MLRTRLLSAALLTPVVLAVLVLGEPWIALFLGVLVFLALVELIGLLDAAGFAPPQVLLLVSGMVTAAAGLLTANRDSVSGPLNELMLATEPPGLIAVVFSGSMLLLGAASFTRTDPRAGFLTWATSVFGIAYVAILLPAIAMVVHLAPAGGSAATQVGIFDLPSGTAWGFMLLLLVWSYDSGAYLTGRWLGRRRLIDHISPSKTVEGVAGGLVAATLGAGIGAALVGLEPWHPLVIGPLVGLAAQAGDLAESLVKRAAGRKESGFLVPGHGGILDRVDSFLFAAPVLVGYALLVAGRTL